MLLKCDCEQSELYNNAEQLGLYCLNDIYVAAAKFSTTVLLCWSDDEAARYLYTLKMYENKTDTVLQGWQGCGHKGEGWGKKEWDAWAMMGHNQRTAVLVKESIAQMKGMNKTNAAILLNKFGSLKQLVLAPNY